MKLVLVAAALAAVSADWVQDKDACTVSNWVYYMDADCKIKYRANGWLDEAKGNEDNMNKLGMWANDGNCTSL